MATLNVVHALGNLTRDPELKFLPSGSPVCNFTIAANRKWKAQDGTWKEEVAWIPVTCWGKQAESCGEYLRKGSSVLVEGRLQTRQWETPEGQKRSMMDVCADRVHFLDKKAEPAQEKDISF